MILSIHNLSSSTVATDIATIAPGATVSVTMSAEKLYKAGMHLNALETAGSISTSITDESIVPNKFGNIVPSDAATLDNLSSVATAAGASLIGVEDAAQWYATTPATVESALIELTAGSDEAFRAGTAADTALENTRTHFHVETDVTIVQAAAGLDLIPTIDLPSGSAIHIDGVKVLVNGGTLWDGAFTKLTIQDLAVAPKLMVDIAKAGLAANAIMVLGSADITALDGLVLGGTTDKGIKIISDNTIASGSTLKVVIWGRAVPAAI